MAPEDGFRGLFLWTGSVPAAAMLPRKGRRLMETVLGVVHDALVALTLGVCMWIAAVMWSLRKG